LRVLPTVQPGLKALPGETLPAQEPTCPTGLTPHRFAVSAIDLNISGGNNKGRLAAFVPTALAPPVIPKNFLPEPLVLHVAAGECVEVTLTNRRATARASFHLGGLLHDLDSSGINIGNNPGDETVAPGASRTYTYFADSQRIESAIVTDFGSTTGGADGLYGAVVVAPAGSTFSSPFTGQATDVGTQVDVHVPGAADYRDLTTILADHDPRIGQDTMPYPTAIQNQALINYRQVAPRTDNADMFSSLVNGAPATPLLRAYAGDQVKVHAIGAPGNEQLHVFSLGGMSWPGDMYITNANKLQSRGVGPWEKTDILISGGAGGETHQPGDYFYGDLRRPFTDVGMWGLLRVSTPGAGPIRTLQFTSLPTGPVTPATRTPISKLILGSRLSKATIVKSGVAFRLTGPTDTRALRVKLYRVGTKNVLVGTSVIEVIGTKAFNKLSRSAKAKRSRLIVAGNGRIRAIWKPTPKLLKALRAGRYRLDVQGGAGRTSIDPTVLRAKTRITAPPVVKKALVTNAAGH
jgi:hypothetical protein